MRNNPGYDGTAVRQPGVPTYHIAGWYDTFVRDSLLWFENLCCVKRLTIGPWAHSGSAGIDLVDVYRSWFELWLGDEDEHGDGGEAFSSQVDYYTIGAPPGERWRSAECWPPPGFEPTALSLAAGPSGTSASINDGVLAEGPPPDGGRDVYVVDYTTTWAQQPDGPTATEGRSAIPT